MTFASRATSLVVTVQESKKVTPRVWELVRFSTAHLIRLWWHTKAYGTILMIGLLTLLSLVFVRIHSACRKLLLVSTHQGVGGYRWQTFSRKSLD